MTISPFDALVVSEKVVLEKIGDIRANADLAYAEKLIATGITRRDEMGVWGSAIELITKEMRRLEKVRDFFLEPIKEAKKAVEAARKKQSDMFDGTIELLRDIKKKLDGPFGNFVLKCDLEDKAKAKVEQDAKLKAIADQAKTDGNDFMAAVETDVVLLEPEKKSITKVKTTTGSTSVRFLDRVKLTDINKVPRQYLVIDEAKLLADFASGLITEVPGVEFYQVPATWVR